MTRKQAERHKANDRGLRRQLAIVADPAEPIGRRKRAARYAAALAEKLGILERPQRCSWCRRRLPLERHHPDHARPLEIVYLCRDDHLTANGMARSADSA